MAKAWFQLDFCSGPKITLVQTLFKFDIHGMTVRCVRGKEVGPVNADGTFQWTSAVKAVCMVTLRSLLSESDDITPPYITGLRGSPAASLDYAITKAPEWVVSMFGVAPGGYPVCKRIFRKANSHLKRPGPILIGFNPLVLPPSALRIVLDGKEVSDYSGRMALWSQLDGQHDQGELITAIAS